MKRKPWEFYLDLKCRSLYKNKYLKGRGLTASQTAEIMRKFKVYIDRINQSPISIRVRTAESITQLVHILNGVFTNEWKNHIKDSYKDMPYYFYDYAKFVELIIEFIDMLVSKTKLKDLYWPDGSPIKIEPFPISIYLFSFPIGICFTSNFKPFVVRFISATFMIPIWLHIVIKALVPGYVLLIPSIVNFM